MDAAGIAVTLAMVAAHLVVKASAFRKRMKGRQTLLDGLVDSCAEVRRIAKMIEAHLRAEPRQTETYADQEEDPWHVLAITLGGMNGLLEDFDKELGEITRDTATTKLGRAILQLKTDDSIPRIRQIQEEIKQKYSSLLICIQFVFW